MITKTIKQCMVFILTITIIEVTALSITACSADNGSNGGYINSAVIAGNYFSDSGSVACYWKNGKRTDLNMGSARSVANPVSSFTRDIFIDGADEYIAGYIGYDNDKKNACYWKNGEITVLENHSDYTEANTFAIAIIVKETDIYVLGSVSYIHLGEESYEYTCYWKNGVMTVLEEHKGFIGSSLAVMGTDVYIAGYIYTYNDPKGYNENKACYWKNDEITYLDVDGSDQSSAYHIAISGNDVYISGMYALNRIDENGNYENYYSCYWKNDERINLQVPEDAIISYPDVMAVSGSDIYIAGSYRKEELTDPETGATTQSGGDIGCYWKNGVMVEFETVKSKSLPDFLTPQSRPKSIAIDGTDIYIAGEISDWDFDGFYYSEYMKACYWINNEIFILHSGSSEATGVDIIEE